MPPVQAFEKGLQEFNLYHNLYNQNQNHQELNHQVGFGFGNSYQYNLGCGNLCTERSH